MMLQLDKMLPPLLFLTLLALARGDSPAGKEEDADNGLLDDSNLAFETFGSPIYGAYPYGTSPLGARPPYGYPPYPGPYAGYFANPYAYGTYSRYASLPSAFSPALGYGSPAQGALGYGYGYSTPLSRYGGLGIPYYNSPYYPVTDRLRYPAYPVAGLGYRYGGSAYIPPAPVKGSPAARVDSPVVARVAALPRYPPAYPLAAPVPVARIPPPPAAYAPYRSMVRATQAKDGSLRYPDVPVPVDAVGAPLY